MAFYLGWSICNGVVSFGNGWSFWSAFVVSIFATPLVGSVFVWIRGTRVDPRTGKHWRERDL